MKTLQTLCISGLLLMPAHLGLAQSGVAPVQGNCMGWEAYKLSNRHVSLQVAPAIGGRVIQYSLGKDGFFWVNPELAGKAPPLGGVGPEESWLNYGGDKLWPAPQGWDNDRQWPGPPDGILDGGSHAAEIVPGGLKLTSQPSPRFGIQFVRTIRLDANSTRVRFEVIMRNTGDKPRRWGIWEHAQLDAALPSGRPNAKLKSYCALDPRSHFERGYQVIFGAPENSSWAADPKEGLFTATYLYQVGKAVVDSPGGWAATVNGANGTVFVQLFDYERDRDYPDGASVEFWHNGTGSFKAFGKENVMPEDPKKNPYVAESELISPYFELAPGGSCNWNYQWCAANLGGDFPVVDCTPVAAVSAPLRVELLEGGRARITGRWGVFEPGSLIASWLGKDGLPLGRLELGKSSPDRAFVLDTKAATPAEAVSLKLELADDSGATRGELGRTFVPRAKSSARINGGAKAAQLEKR